MYHDEKINYKEDMRYIIFKNKMLEEVPKYFCKDCKGMFLRLTKKTKINIDEEAFVLDNVKISPVVSVPKAFEAFLKENEKGMSFTAFQASFAIFMEDAYMDGLPYIPNIEILDWNTCKNYIIPVLVSTKKNEELLKNVPHKNWFDLSIIYRYLINNNTEEDKTVKAQESILITNNLLAKMNIPIPDFIKEGDIFSYLCDTLHAFVMNNLKIEKNITIRNIWNIINTSGVDTCSLPFDIPSFLLPENYLYCVTTKYASNGAAAILYPDILKQIAVLFKDDFYILPSSVHEVLVCKAEGKEEKELLSMVRYINQNEVLEEDFLSDNIYKYDKNTGVITMIS